MFYHSTLGLRVIKKKKRREGVSPLRHSQTHQLWQITRASLESGLGEGVGVSARGGRGSAERDFFLDNLLVRIHSIIEMI